MSLPSLRKLVPWLPVAVGLHVGCAVAFVLTVFAGLRLFSPAVMACSLLAVVTAAVVASRRPTLERDVHHSGVRTVVVGWWVLAVVFVLLALPGRWLVASVLGFGAILAFVAIETVAARMVLADDRAEDAVLVEWTARPPRRWTWGCRVVGLVTILFWLSTLWWVDYDALVGGLPVTEQFATLLLGVPSSLGFHWLFTTGREQRYVLTEETLFVGSTDAGNWSAVPLRRFRRVERGSDALVLRRGLPWPVSLRCRLSDLDVETVHTALGRVVSPPSHTTPVRY